MEYTSAYFLNWNKTSCSAKVVLSNQLVTSTFVNSLLTSFTEGEFNSLPKVQRTQGIEFVKTINENQNLGQTSSWSSLVKGEKYITTLTNLCNSFNKFISQLWHFHDKSLTSMMRTLAWFCHSIATAWQPHSNRRVTTLPQHRSKTTYP